jgi:sulfate permease, SulP family
LRKGPTRGVVSMSVKLPPRLVAAVPGVGLLTTLRKDRLRPDGLAALSLWALLIPQGLAYAQLAGLSPSTGLYTAAGAMLLYALFGTSRYMNVGPESSVAVLVLASVVPLAGDNADKYASLVSVLAILVALFLFIGYLLKLGVVARLLSAPVLTGYLAGSAVVITMSQLSKVLGITVEGTGRTVLGEVLDKISQTNLKTLGVAIFTFALVLLVDRFLPRLPAVLIGIVGATIIVMVWNLDKDIAVVGNIKSGLPVPHLPDVATGDIIDLLPSAASIAVLIFASSFLTGRSLAARDGEDIDANREFLGLGAANIASGVLGGFPANASDSRSFLIVDSGGRSQVVNLIGTVMVLGTLLVTPLFKDVPQAALGAVVIITALKLIDVRELRRLWRVRRADFALATITFVGVLIFGVLGGIAVGIVASLLEAMRRAMFPHTAVLGMVGGEPIYRDIENYKDAETLPGLIIYRFDAALFFANADMFREQILRLVSESDDGVREVIVNAEAIYDVDTTGLASLERVALELRNQGVRISMARVRTPLRLLMRRTGIESEIGAQNFYLRVTDAVAAHQSRSDNAEDNNPEVPD